MESMVNHQKMTQLQLSQTINTCLTYWIRRTPSQKMKKMRLIPLDIPNHGMIMIMHTYKLSQRYLNWQIKRYQTCEGQNSQ
jgi:hypothetical protein